jgi:hypothetical protein
VAKRFQDFEISIAANDLNENVLNGTLFQQIGDVPQLLALYETGSAAGLERNFVIGTDTKVPFGPVNANNRVPNSDQDFIIDGIEAYPGANCFLAVRNTTAGALTYRFRIWYEDAMEV